MSYPIIVSSNALILRRYTSFGDRCKYRPEIPWEMLTYFQDCEQAGLKTVSEWTAVEYEDGKPVSGTKKTETRLICGTLPTFERFSLSVGVTVQTLHAWKKTYPEFAESYLRCQQIQKDFMIQGLVSGRMPANGGIFVAKNITDMVDDSTVNVKATAAIESPPIELRERTPAELAKLKEVVMQAEALGYKITISDAETAPQPAAASLA